MPEEQRESMLRHNITEPSMHMYWRPIMEERVARFKLREAGFRRMVF